MMSRVHIGLFGGHSADDLRSNACSTFSECITIPACGENDLDKLQLQWYRLTPMSLNDVMESDDEIACFLPPDIDILGSYQRYHSSFQNTVSRCTESLIAFQKHSAIQEENYQNLLNDLKEGQHHLQKRLELEQQVSALMEEVASLRARLSAANRVKSDTHSQLLALRSEFTRKIEAVAAGLGGESDRTNTIGQTNTVLAASQWRFSPNEPRIPKTGGNEQSAYTGFGRGAGFRSFGANRDSRGGVRVPVSDGFALKGQPKSEDPFSYTKLGPAKKTAPQIPSLSLSNIQNDYSVVGNESESESDESHESSESEPPIVIEQPLVLSVNRGPKTIPPISMSRLRK